LYGNNKLALTYLKRSIRRADFGDDGTRIVDVFTRPTSNKISIQGNAKLKGSQANVLDLTPTGRMHCRNTLEHCRTTPKHYVIRMLDFPSPSVCLLATTRI
jgi:hypothetical protein